MKTVQINAPAFFELLKAKDTSVWEIFAQMIDGEQKKLLFTDENNQLLFDYILPADHTQLEEDRKVFAKEYTEKLSAMN